MENVSNKVTEKVTSLLDQAYSVRVNDLDQSTLLAEEALLLSKECNRPALVARCLNQISLFQMIRGEYEASVELAEEAIEYFDLV